MTEFKQLRCSKCRRFKRYNAFAKLTTVKNIRGNRQYVCRKCTSKYDAGRYKRIATKVRINQLKYYYGITPDQYHEMYKNQEGLCWICKVPKDPWQGIRGTSKTACLYVDHDHSTNKVRGLLCNRCNFGLGNFSDDPELIQRALLYISQ